MIYLIGKSKHVFIHSDDSLNERMKSYLKKHKLHIFVILEEEDYHHMLVFTTHHFVFGTVLRLGIAFESFNQDKSSFDLMASSFNESNQDIKTPTFLWVIADLI